jgi:hypothetical protein
MTVAHAILHFDLPYVQGKKGRRAVLNSIKDRLKKRNLSLLDVSGEYPKEGILAIAFLSLSEEEARKKLTEIEELIYKTNAELAFDMEYELL